MAESTRGGLMAHGISTCAGCGMELVLRTLLDVLGEDTVLLVPPGCAALFCGFGRETVVKVAALQCNLENTAANGAGVRAGLHALGNDHTNVLCFAGDGATIDIGLQALSGALERRDRILYVCYDNEAYMNTGVQGSGSTPRFASTTTTPGGKTTWKKDLMQIAMAHDIPYAATVSLHDLPDFRRKVEKAKHADGPALLHVLTPCPTGWRFDTALTIQLARAAVETGCWVLYEYENGRATLNQRPNPLRPIEAYIGPQKRFAHMTEADRADFQAQVRAHFEGYVRRLELI